MILSFNSFGQKPEDYEILNLLIQSDDPLSEKEPPVFLKRMHYWKNGMNTKRVKGKNQLSNYQHTVDGLFKDTLMQYQHTIGKASIRKSFVKWNTKAIAYDKVADTAEYNYFYYTQPVFLSETLFVVLSFHKMPLGGISACLYQWDKETRTITYLRSRTQQLIGIQFR